MINFFINTKLIQIWKIPSQPILILTMKNIFFIILVLVISSPSIFAQQPANQNTGYKIKGRLVDSASKHPLEYATLSLFLKGDKAPSNGAVTDSKGNFTIDNITTGTYKLVAEFLGYKPFTLPNLQIDKDHTLIDTKNILLSSTATTLQNINVAVQGKLIENKIDKLVFNAERDLTSQSGVATDILKKVPQVSVDVDGNVQLAGSSSIRFLINGKPSSAFGSSISDVLQSIPASQIKSIEVITNPGAKYDAQGLGGIINIILKNNNAQGVNGNVSLTAGTRMENGSFNFNVRKGKFGMNAFVSGNARLRSQTLSSSDRITSDTTANTKILLHQDGFSRFQRSGYQTGINFDWDPDKHNNFSGSLSYNNFSNTGNSSVNQDQNTQGQNGIVLSDIQTFRNADNAFHFHNIDAGINYKKTFAKEGQELEIAVNSSFGNNNSNNDNYQFSLPQHFLYYGTVGNNPGKEKETEITIDYAQPLKKAVILGVGSKINLYDITSNSNVLNLDPVSGKYATDNFLSNSLDYHQKVYALYSEISFPVFTLFDAKIGNVMNGLRSIRFIPMPCSKVKYPGIILLFLQYFFQKN